MSLDPQINKCSNTISSIYYVLLCSNLFFKYFSHVLCKSLSSSQTPYWINYKVALRDHWTLAVTLTVYPHGARVGPCTNRPCQKWLLCYFADEAVRCEGQCWILGISLSGITGSLGSQPMQKATTACRRHFGEQIILVRSILDVTIAQTTA